MKCRSSIQTYSILYHMCSWWICAESQVQCWDLQNHQLSFSMSTCIWRLEELMHMTVSETSNSIHKHEQTMTWISQWFWSNRAHPWLNQTVHVSSRLKHNSWGCVPTFEQVFLLNGRPHQNRYLQQILWMWPCGGFFFGVYPSHVCRGV